MTNVGAAWEMDVRGVWHGSSIRNLAKGGIKYKPTTGITGDRCVQRYREAVSDQPTPGATSLPHKQQAISARYEASTAHQVLATPSSRGPVSGAPARARRVCRPAGRPRRPTSSATRARHGAGSLMTARPSAT